MKTKFRKDLDREIQSKLLLKDATLWAITRHLLARIASRLKQAYGNHTQLVWESLAGLGWAMFVLTWLGVV